MYHNELVKIMNNNPKHVNSFEVLENNSSNKEFLDQTKLDMIRNQINELNHSNLVVNDHKYRGILVKK